MGFTKLIDANLTRAFNLVKDLAVMVTLIKKSGTSFDFNLGETLHLKSSNFDIKAIILNSEKTSSTAVFKTLMFKSAQLQGITGYDGVMISKVLWNIGEKLKDDGVIILLDVYKEL
jgi:hypothetical protein